MTLFPICNTPTHALHLPHTFLEAHFHPHILSTHPPYSHTAAQFSPQTGHTPHIDHPFHLLPFLLSISCQLINDSMLCLFCVFLVTKLWSELMLCGFFKIQCRWIRCLAGKVMGILWRSVRWMTGLKISRIIVRLEGSVLISAW